MIIKYIFLISLIYLCSLFSFCIFVNNNNILEYLFVSSYFKNPQIVEHSFMDYMKWKDNLFRIINGSLVVFTDFSREAENIVKGYNKIKVHKYHSIWDIPCYTNSTKFYYDNLLKDDPYRMIHNSFLYAIYNAKIWFLTKSTQLFQSKLYIWIDIGCIRSEILFLNFPDIKSVKYLANFNSMFFFVINNKHINKSNQSGMLCERLIEGGIYGGTKKSIREFNDLFWNIHNSFLKKRNCLYDDQNILLTTIAKYKNVNLFSVYNRKLCTKLLWMKFVCLFANYNKYKIQPDNIDNYIKYEINKTLQKL